MKLIALVFAIFLFTASCSQKDVLTEPEKTGQQVNNVLSAAQVQLVDVYFGSGAFTRGAPYRIEGAFLVISRQGTTDQTDRYVNFSQLHSYKVDLRSNGNVGVLYFSQ